MQLAAAADEAGLRRLVLVRRGLLRDVEGVLDLHVWTEALQIVAEVGLSVRQEDRLVAGAERREDEVPPAHQHERDHQHRDDRRELRPERTTASPSRAG